MHHRYSIGYAKTKAKLQRFITLYSDALKNIPFGGLNPVRNYKGLIVPLNQQSVLRVNNLLYAASVWQVLVCDNAEALLFHARTPRLKHVLTGWSLYSARTSSSIPSSSETRVLYPNADIFSVESS